MDLDLVAVETKLVYFILGTLSPAFFLRTAQEQQARLKVLSSDILRL